MERESWGSLDFGAPGPPAVVMHSESIGTNSCLHTQNSTEAWHSCPLQDLTPAWFHSHVSACLCFQAGPLDLFQSKRLSPRTTGLLFSQPLVGSALAKHRRQPLTMKIQANAEDGLSDKKQPGRPRSMRPGEFQQGPRTILGV